ncbi:heme ABC transporter ATP-binding protein [Flavihumibacter rivuli]|uniref:heme ABC transporter ATP-binding protein n=1 Tax=Flavihumibacter rivuli TaxID=2838156 RepID=UPI001BDEFCC6|nr:heme ABC transporter ATP-binding protein [Flavihumibacter rivuli]ULQ55939.1 heme ABC transporter ATP-binding protein [Flavihumibacter rivuli]
MVKLEQVEYSSGKKRIIQKLDVCLEAGKLHVIIGPNGSGKSTTLKLIAGELNPTSGKVFLNGIDLKNIGKAELARFRAVMSQHAQLSFPLPVGEVVMMGRYPFFDIRPSAADESIVETAMQRTGVRHLAGRDYLTLSGGEKQRVQFARVLAQLESDGEPSNKLLLLDEAVASLDIKFQHQVLKEAKALVNQGVTVVCILHDLNLGLQYGDSLLMMKEGSMVYRLDQPHNLTPAMIRDVFDVEASIIQPHAANRPVIVY